MNHTMKNSTLTYHEIYGQPDSFQAILNTLPEIEATLDEVFSEKYDQLIFICGHYEGFDARISENLADEIISIGDFVLTGGELPAMIITDAVSRMLPGVLGSEESAPTDSFYNGLLEHPQYTRPREFEGMAVPDVLLSGDHAKIAKWRREKSLEITLRNRPDLLETAELTDDDRKYIEQLKQGLKSDK